MTPHKGSRPATKASTQSPTKKKLMLKKVGKRPPKGRTAQWSLLRRAGVKSPRNAYALWSNENRRRIQRELGCSDFATVSRAMGEAWAALSEEARAPYVARQEQMRSVYFDAKAAYLEYAKKHTQEKKTTGRKVGKGRTTIKKSPRKAAK